MTYHIHSQLLGFQINPISHIPLSINSLHSYRHLSSFHLCVLLRTLASNLHLHLQVLFRSACLLSLVLYIRLNTLTFIFLIVSGTHNFSIWVINSITTVFVVIYCNTIGIKHRLISVNIYCF